MKLSVLKNYIINLDKWLDRHCTICLLLLLLTILRIPNFFDPYWYGDEAIYLTIGDAITKGARLYADIVDHKTPLIYYLATVPNQLAFRVLLYFWMFISTISFYTLSKRIFTNHLVASLSTLLFVIYTSLPRLEGHIPNGELFVIGFILLGATFLTNISYIKKYFLEKSQTISTQSFTSKELLTLFAAGFFFGLALLTKVPALFDIAAFFLLLLFLCLQNIYLHKISGKTIRQMLLFFISRCGVLGIGFITPLTLSIIYFYSIGAGTEYLNFGLLYNFHYSSAMMPTFSSPIITFAFTFLGKFLIMLGMLLALLVVSSQVSPSFLFISAWCVLALFATLLSNRPYPHYFLQLVPPFSLLAGLIVHNSLELVTKLKEKISIQPLVIQLSLSVLIIIICSRALYFLNVVPYQTQGYYTNWWQYITGKIDRQLFYQRFNYLMPDNYAAAQIIAEAGDKHTFIWGTNPGLYALSDTIPSGRFTVAFHIEDLKNAGSFEETMRDIQETQPTFIVFMKDQQTAFPTLEAYMQDRYVLYKTFDYFYLYKKISST